jgi:hypothetical protein
LVDLRPDGTGEGETLAQAPVTGLEEGIGIVLRAEEAGQAPDLADWLAHHPDLAGELALFLAGQRGIQTAASQWGAAEVMAPPEVSFKQRVGGLELGEEIDRGGMGVVYRAYDPSLRREVAVKRVISGVFTSSTERARFRFEAEAAAGLSHPAVVPIHAFGDEGGQPYLVMALMEGGSLAQRLRNRKPGQGMPALEAAELIRDVALGAHHAHQRGLLHRDLKPGNILFDGQGRPHIADFGLALTLEATFSLSRSMAGTAGYMAPERLGVSRA